MKLVLLPGLHGSAQLFEPFIAQLAPEIDSQVISYPSDIKLDYRQLSNLVLAQLPGQDFILLGESFSGPLAYQLALRKPAKLKAVILVASFLHNPRPLLLNSFTTVLVRILLKFPLSTFAIKIGLTGTEASEHIVALCKQTLNTIPSDLLAFRLAEIVRLPSQHSPCNHKLIVIQALHDKLVPQSCLAPFKRLCNDLKIETINSGHFVLQTQPEACAQIVVKVIDRLAN